LFYYYHWFINKDAGSDGIFVKTDVANEDDVKALVDKAIKVGLIMPLIILVLMKQKQTNGD
jgi:hypothetical protein